MMETNSLFFISGEVHTVSGPSASLVSGQYQHSHVPSSRHGTGIVLHR